VQCRAELQREPTNAESVNPLAGEVSSLNLVTSDGQPYSAHQTEHYERYQQVMALRKQGMKVKEIASRVGLGKRTIQRWCTLGEYVETNYHHQHRSRFDAYEAYVMRRWEEGCHNIEQLWREIKAQGYPHSEWRDTGASLSLLVVVRDRIGTEFCCCHILDAGQPGQRIGQANYLSTEWERLF
jgi:hypothetical protein